MDLLRKRSSDVGEADVWRKEGDMWYYRDALYVPLDSATQVELLRIHHNDELASHFSRNKTEELLRRKYW